MQVERIDEKVWMLLAPWTSPVFPDLTVPAGYIFDGASIPVAAQMLINNADYGVLEASCLHDYLYENAGFINDDCTMTRKQVDMIFESELTYYDIDSFTAYLAYLAVRSFGRSHWG